MRVRHEPYIPSSDDEECRCVSLGFGERLPGRASTGDIIMARVSTLFGLGLLAGAVCTMYLNDRCVVYDCTWVVSSLHLRRLSVARSPQALRAVQAPCSHMDPANEGRLVHLSGCAKSLETLSRSRARSMGSLSKRIQTCARPVTWTCFAGMCIGIARDVSTCE